MRSAQEVTPEKLRGGYYTPPALAEFCLSRLSALAPDRDTLRVLEPSIGDGAFVRALDASRLRTRVDQVVGFEILEMEAEKARQAVLDASFTGQVETRSVIDWARQDGGDDFDLAVGNPPFVRFQFVSPADRIAAEHLAVNLGVPVRGVSNLWIPVLLGALSKLRIGGAFSFVIPTECFTGSSAQVARDWLTSNTDGLHSDLFPPGSFPGVLQEVTILSGVRRSRRQEGSASITITEHDPSGGQRTWTHATVGGESWTRYLLEPAHLAAVAEATAAVGIQPLGRTAAFEVSLVTGANDFFSVDRETIARYALQDWARPLLPRIRHAAGLRYTPADQLVTEEKARAWILDFASDRDDPRNASGAARYIELGEARELDRRFKCRIREPWFRVPNFRRGALLLSKRSHGFPRVVVNEASVFTTDTIYRGRLLTDDLTPQAFAASFHNSLTLLTAEIEGRSFGGGVLELVPSEVSRLQVPVVRAAESWLNALDERVRTDPGFDLTEATDERLIQASVLPRALLETLSEARYAMLRRRMDRNAGAPTDLMAAAA